MTDSLLRESPRPFKKKASCKSRGQTSPPGRHKVRHCFFTFSESTPVSAPEPKLYLTFMFVLLAV